MSSRAELPEAAESRDPVRRGSAGRLQAIAAWDLSAPLTSFAPVEMTRMEPVPFAPVEMAEKDYINEP